MSAPAIRQVLFASDLTDDCHRALDHARLIADRFGARLTLYHATEIPDHAQPHWAFAHEHEVWSRAEREARSHLETEARELGLPCEVLVERVTSPGRALLALIRERQPDLTVMATHCRTGLKHFVLGSVTEQVFRHAFHPVLCVRQPGHEAPLPYRRVLVPTDLSLASRLAFPIAAQFARTFGAGVVAVHVTAPTGRTPEGGDVPSESALWKFVKDEFEGVDLTARVYEGPVWDRIVHTATVEKADLIVMATRGHDSLSDVILGSNTDRVVRHAPCPVLVA